MHVGYACGHKVITYTDKHNRSYFNFEVYSAKLGRVVHAEITDRTYFRLCNEYDNLSEMTKMSLDNMGITCGNDYCYYILSTAYFNDDGSIIQD